LATVRIFKIAELLGTTSQEVTALLKRDHGIEVKSASSTVEEVVARQFVERVARQRNISLPTSNMFADTPAAKGKKGTPSKKAAEPVKPAAPALPPPRLVKTIKPVIAPVAEPESIEEPEPVEAPAAEPGHAPIAASAETTEAPPPIAEVRHAPPAPSASMSAAPAVAEPPVADEPEVEQVEHAPASAVA
jgi:hypothetical protein